MPINTPDGAALAHLDSDGVLDAAYVINGRLRYALNPGNWATLFRSPTLPNLGDIARFEEGAVGTDALLAAVGAKLHVVRLHEGSLLNEPLADVTDHSMSAIDLVTSRRHSLFHSTHTTVVLYDGALGRALPLTLNPAAAPGPFVLPSAGQGFDVPVAATDTALVFALRGSELPQFAVAHPQGVDLYRLDGQHIVHLPGSNAGAWVEPAPGGTKGTERLAYVTTSTLYPARLGVWDQQVGTTESNFDSAVASGLAVVGGGPFSPSSYVISSSSGIGATIIRDVASPPAGSGFGAPIWTSAPWATGTSSTPMVGSLDFDGTPDLILVDERAGAARIFNGLQTHSILQENDVVSLKRQTSHGINGPDHTLMLEMCSQEQFEPDANRLRVVVWALQVYGDEFLQPDVVADVSFTDLSGDGACGDYNLSVEIPLNYPDPMAPPDLLAIEFQIDEVDYDSNEVTRLVTKLFLQTDIPLYWNEIHDSLPGWWAVEPCTSCGAVRTPGIIRTPRIPRRFPVDHDPVPAGGQ